MYKLLIAAGFISILLSCNAQSSQKNNSSNMVEGKDYVILKRFRIEDKLGFNHPLEVSSFVLPANWQVNSSVQWDVTKKCFPEMIQASVKATSPDGDYELMLFPVTQFDWSTDAVQLDAMKRGFYPHACYIAQPTDAAGYIKYGLAPYVKAQVKLANTIPELQQQMDASALQMSNTARQAGNNAYSHRGSAAEGVLQFEDGKEGLAFCTIMQTIVTMPGTQGGMASNIQCYAGMRIVLKYKAGNNEMARKIMSTFFSSTRLNPQWFGGVQAFYAAVTSNAQNQLWKQIQITQKAQQEIGDNIIRSWEARNNTAASASKTDTDGFGQYLRGVENYTDESGNKIELTSGYTNAWSKSDGSYLMSNNPAFDPNVTFNEDWKRLNK
ncbi:hypothetical protein [Ferruginibacter sp.]|nr:hypothetical protein [Ferruginibacter sp.]